MQGFYAHPQNVYQQMGIPQPQPHLNHGAPPRPVPPQPVRYSASNPPTSSFPNQPPQPPPVQQRQQSLLRPLPAPTTLLPSPKPPSLPPAPTASRPLPTPGKPTATDPPFPSTQLPSSSSPPKRRQSPPKFTSDPTSRSNSPSKPFFPSNRETLTTNKPAPTSASITTSLASSSPPKPLTTTHPPSSSLISKPTPTDGQQLPTKATPVWKRTIPEIPAPVWGYAAGLVADPHPKLSNQPPPTSVATVSESPTKSTGAPNKLKKKNKTKENDATRDEGKKVNNKTKDQINAVHGNAYGLGYSSRQAQQQRHSAYHVAHQAPYSSSRTSATAYRPEEDHDEDDDDEDEETEDAQTVATTEEEVTEETEEEEETGEEEGASDSVPTLRRFGHGNGHRRYYSQPVVNGGVMHRREEGYHGSAYDYEEEEEEEEDTPKKRNFVPGNSKPPTEKKVLLRPKVKVDPYGGYEDVSPIGHGGRKPVRPRSEIGDVGGRRMFGAVDTMSGTPRNGRMFRRSEDETTTTRTNHRRPRSAIEEREMLILNVRARNRMKNREVESDYGAEETRLAYDDDHDDDRDYEEEEEDAMVNDRRRRWRGEGLNYRPQSQPNPSPRLMNGGRSTTAGLPRPPPMSRDQDSAAFVSHSQPEKKIRGGPRSAFVQVVSEEEPEGQHEEERSWPGDLPRLPRTPGGGGGVRRGYFGPARSDSDLNLDEPPPPASIVRTPSPGVTGGYILQEREVQSQNRSRSTGFEQAHRRFEVVGDAQQPAQGRVYSRLGHPPQSASQPQVPQQRRQQMYPPQQGRYTTTPSPRKQQQTPAPPRPVGIESPYPVGGRDRMADMNKLERIEDENGQIQARRISGVRNVSKVMVMADSDNNMVPQRRDIPTMSVSDESDRRPLPSPSSPRTHAGSRPQSMVITGFGGSPKKQALPTQAPVREDTPRSRTADLNSSANPNNNDMPDIQVFDVPGVYISKPGFDDDPNGGVTINISGPGEDQTQTQHRKQPQPPSHPNPPHSQYITPTPGGPHTAHAGGNNNNGRGLLCGGCHGPITHGRILSAMGLRWHPPCFKCSVCDTLLEHVSSYENDGKAYCHLDYHEAFAPRCYSCKTSIIDEQFISLDDPALGKRTYHTQHFFCAECGDPFLDPSIPLPTDANGELLLTGDGEFEGFIVYRGYPYCEACHVRLRLPKCKRCKKAIRDDEKAVEALGGKWCWACFVCAGCSNPFEDPSFFQRGNQPYCENCFSIMLRNEV